MVTFKNFCIWIFSIIFLFLSACTDDGTSTSDTGTLSLSLTDASTAGYKAVYVTIDKVQVHIADNESQGNGNNNWITVGNPQKTYNLLELVNGVMEQLGVTDLESGKYTQMRLYLGSDPDGENNILGNSHPFPNYVIDEDDDEVHDLKVPGGYESGIKLVCEFDITEGLTVDLVMDFDASASVIKAGESGQYLLKPTIKVLDTINNAILEGTVTDNQQIGLEDGTVSAQIYNPEADNVKDLVTSYTSTLTSGDDGNNNTGEYMMFLPPGTYNIVVYKPEYNPECRNITAALDDLLTEDFELIPAEFMGTVSGSVTIENPVDTDQSASISIRQLCGTGDEDIEVVSQNVLNGSAYEINLPEGEYTVVASTDGREPFESSINVSEATSPIELDIIFPQP